MSITPETLARVARLIGASGSFHPRRLSDDDIFGRILDALSEKRLLPIVEHDGTSWVAEVKIEDRRIPRYRPTRLAALLAVIDDLPEDSL